MNYSASDDYHSKCRQFDKRRVAKNKIRRRWLRNFYVLYQTKGWFTHNTFVLEAGQFDPDKYFGEYFGPFFKSDAESFAVDLRRTHESFIMG